MMVMRRFITAARRRAQNIALPEALTPFSAIDLTSVTASPNDGWRSHGRRNSRFHLPHRQFRLASSRSCDAGYSGDRRPGGRTDPQGARTGGLDADRYPGHPPP